MLNLAIGFVVGVFAGLLIAFCYFVWTCRDVFRDQVAMQERGGMEDGYFEKKKEVIQSK